MYSGVFSPGACNGKTLSPPMVHGGSMSEVHRIVFHSQRSGSWHLGASMTRRITGHQLSRSKTEVGPGLMFPRSPLALIGRKIPIVLFLHRTNSGYLVSCLPSFTLPVIQMYGSGLMRPKIVYYTTVTRMIYHFLRSPAQPYTMASFCDKSFVAELNTFMVMVGNA